MTSELLLQNRHVLGAERRSVHQILPRRERHGEGRPPRGPDGRDGFPDEAGVAPVSKHRYMIHRGKVFPQSAPGSADSLVVGNRQVDCIVVDPVFVGGADVAVFRDEVAENVAYAVVEHGLFHDRQFRPPDISRKEVVSRAAIHMDKNNTVGVVSFRHEFEDQDRLAVRRGGIPRDYSVASRTDDQRRSLITGERVAHKRDGSQTFHLESPD